MSGDFAGLVPLSLTLSGLVPLSLTLSGLYARGFCRISSAQLDAVGIRSAQLEAWRVSGLIPPRRRRFIRRERARPNHGRGRCRTEGAKRFRPLNLTRSGVFCSRRHPSSSSPVERSWLKLRFVLFAHRFGSPFRLSLARSSYRFVVGPAMALDSSATFAARVRDLGLESVLDRFVELGWTTLGRSPFRRVTPGPLRRRQPSTNAWLSRWSGTRAAPRQPSFVDYISNRRLWPPQTCGGGWTALTTTQSLSSPRRSAKRGGHGFNHA